MSEGGNADRPDDRRDVVERDDRTSTTRETVDAFLASVSGVSLARSDPAHHPIFDKFESEHVTRFLGQIHELDIGELQLRGSSRWFRLVYCLVVVAVFVFLTFFLLPDRADLYFEILKGLGIFVAGGAGGYGLKVYQDQRRNSGSL